MRRAATAIVWVALAGALTLAPSGWSPRGARAEATECGWHRHSKRVVRHVKQDGKARRVSRMSHWWSCDPLDAAPPAGGTPTSPPVLSPLPVAEPTVARLSVKAAEYSYTLSRPAVSAGEVIVELNNQGEDPHNLNLQREGSEDPPLQVPQAASLEHTTERFTLPAGTYRLWCSLSTHDEQGMHTTLVVGDG